MRGSMRDYYNVYGRNENIGKSGLRPDDWADCGKAIAGEMRSFKKKGKCKGCTYFDFTYGCYAGEKYKSKHRKCQVGIDNFSAKCPALKTKKEILV